MAGVSKTELDLMKKFNKYVEDKTKEVSSLTDQLNHKNEELGKQIHLTNNAMHQLEKIQMAYEAEEIEKVKLYNNLNALKVDFANSQKSLAEAERAREQARTVAQVSFTLYATFLIIT